MKLIGFFAFLLSIEAGAQLPESFPIETFKVYSKILSTNPKKACLKPQFLPPDLRKDSKACQAAVFKSFDLCIRQDQSQAHRPTSIGSAGEYRALVTEVRNCANMDLAKKFSASTEMEKSEDEATPSAKSPVSIEARFLEQIKISVERVSKIRDRIKKRDRGMCPGYRPTDAIGCLNHAFQDISVNSSATLVSLATLAPTAALMDRNSGLSDKRLKLKVAESIVILLERVQPAQLLASTLPAHDLADEVSKKRIQKTEYELLLNTRGKLLDEVAKVISTYPTRSVASDDANQKLANDLRSRALNVRNLNWSIP